MLLWTFLSLVSFLCFWTELHLIIRMLHFSLTSWRCLASALPSRGGRQIAQRCPYHHRTSPSRNLPCQSSNLLKCKWFACTHGSVCSDLTSLQRVVLDSSVGSWFFVHYPIGKINQSYLREDDTSQYLSSHHFVLLYLAPVPGWSSV